jgi:starch-binding outer membrane protein, SusD/RagB family
MKSKILFLALTLFSFNSCSLDINIYDKLTAENVLNTEEDLNAAVNGLYREIRQGGWQAYNSSWGSLLTMQVACTDEADCNWVWDDQLKYMWTPQKPSDLLSFYLFFTPAITKITAFLERMKPIAVSAPLKKQYTAELRTLRAIFAYDLYDLYGTVPLVIDPEIALNPQKAMDWKPTRPTVEWYVNFVEKELKEAQDNLFRQSDLKDDQWGRMTKGIAQMYLLKLYLHEAGQERHYRSNEARAMHYWAKVDSITNVMIHSNQYSLQNDYMSIWSPDNQRNKEVIFAVPSVAGGGLGNMFLALTLPPDYVSRNGVLIKRSGGLLSTWETYDSYNPGDKRRQALVAEYWNGEKMINRRTDKITGKSAPFPMKYQENPSTTGTYDASDYVINRYAEVLLARAEALNEIEGPTQQVKNYIHDVRKRAFDNYSGSTHEQLINNITTKEELRNHLLNERLWEFCWEGMRRPDLIRHGKLISNALARGKFNAEPKHILYCIPQKVIYENPTIDQNPGWD